MNLPSLCLIVLLIGFSVPAGRAEEPTPAPSTAPVLEEETTPRTRVISGIKGDVLGGGWIAASVLSGSANAIVRTMRGEDPDDAAQHALKDLTKTEFLLGSLLAGSAGAALGSALPVPVLRGAPMFVRTAGAAAAPLAFAALASTLGSNAIALHRRGKLTGKNLMRSVDWWNLFGQTAGSLLGMSLGATLVSAGLAPAFALGSVALVPLLGGIAGAVAGAAVVNWFRSRRTKKEDAAAAGSGANPTGPNAPKKTGAPALAVDGVGGAAVAPEVLAVDPFADLRVTPGRAR